MAAFSGQGREVDPAADRLFVTKIPQLATREDVAAYFARFGVTTDVYLPAVPGLPGHKGIAFVSFSDPSALQLAISHGPHEIQGQEVVVDVAAPRGAQLPGQALLLRTEVAAPVNNAELVPEAAADRLFVTKVPPVLQREHLREHFAQFGELTDVYMPAVPGGSTHKGICFVSFSDPASLQLALQHASHEIHGHPVVVDVAAPRGPAPAPVSMRSPNTSGQVTKQWPPSGGQVTKQWSPTSGQVFGFGGTHAQAAPAPPPSATTAAGGYQTNATTMSGNLVNATGVPVPGRLFVTRVTPDMTRVDLQLYFQQFGQLDDVYIPTGGKGIAFVSFRDAVVSQRVLQAQQHFVKPGKAVVVDQALDRPPLGGGATAAFGSVARQQPTRYAPY